MRKACFQSLVIFIIMSIANFGCKTLDKKNVKNTRSFRNIDSLEQRSFSEEGLALVHSELVQAVLDSLGKNDGGEALADVLVRHREELVKDFTDNEKNWRKIFDEMKVSFPDFDNDAIIKAIYGSGKQWTAAKKLAHPFEYALDGGLVYWGKPGKWVNWGNAQVDQELRKLAKEKIFPQFKQILAEDGFNKVINIALEKELGKVKQTLPKSQHAMIDQIIAYFDKFFSLPERKIFAIKGVARQILLDKRGENLTLFTALFDQSGRLSLDSLSAKAFMGLIDQVDPVMQKVLQNVVPLMSPDFQEHLKAVQSNLSPVPEEVITRRIKGAIPQVALDSAMPEGRKYTYAIGQEHIQKLKSDFREKAYRFSCDGGICRYRLGTATMGDVYRVYVTDAQGKLKSFLFKTRKDAIEGAEKIKLIEVAGQFYEVDGAKTEKEIAAIKGQIAQDIVPVGVTKVQDLDLVMKYKIIEIDKSGVKELYRVSFDKSTEDITQIKLQISRGETVIGVERVDSKDLVFRDGESLLFRYEGINDRYKRAQAVFVQAKGKDHLADTMLQIFRDTVDEELDFSKEVQNAKKLRANKYYQGVKSVDQSKYGFSSVQFEIVKEPEGISIGESYKTSCLVMEEERSEKLADAIDKVKSQIKQLTMDLKRQDLSEEVKQRKIQELNAAVERMKKLKGILEIAFENYMKAAFLEGVFHGDPQGGNIFVDLDSNPPKIMYIDTGGSGVLPPTIRKQYINFIVQVQQGNHAGIEASLKEICQSCSHLKGKDLPEEFSRSLSQILSDRVDVDPDVVGGEKRLLEVGERVERIIKATASIPGYRFEGNLEKFQKAVIGMERNLDDIASAGKVFGADLKTHVQAFNVEDFSKSSLVAFKKGIFEGGDIRNAFLAVGAVEQVKTKVVEVNDMFKKVSGIGGVLAAAAAGIIVAEMLDDEPARAHLASVDLGSCEISRDAASICLFSSQFTLEQFELFKSRCKSANGRWHKEACPRDYHLCESHGEEFSSLQFGSRGLSSSDREVFCDEVSRNLANQKH